ncbi:odorant receptor 49b-like [Vanessa atalanta]|uniref:odorant receptor 49b-like n=1 Tax=Vanessa atalanta TaxID=42275 RepID=UPI001FCDA347|nr:odorant receptor 49b-like [Vanessa atalanta]
MFQALTNLEDPANPLLGPTLWGLQTWGMWQPNKGLSRVIYNIIHLLAIIFVLTQYVELWYIRSNLEMALRNLSVTMLSTVCVVKAGTFIAWQKYWKNIFENVSMLEKEQKNKRDDIINRIIKKYTGYSRTVIYFYWCLVTVTVITVILAPLVIYLSSSKRREEIRNGTAAYPEIMSSWAPFDKTRGFGYVILVTIHTLICFYGGGIVANYDANAVVLITFFSGQLEILKSNCERLFGDGQEQVSYVEAVRRIQDCHQHHVILIKYTKILNSLLSPVMFLYVIICSFMFCASAVQLTTEGTTSMQQVWIAEYLIALVVQLFLYCWHSNKVLYMSKTVDEGVYASAWWSQSVSVRRCVLLLSGQLNKTIRFTAGPFTELTVATFVAILKGSYSYYTLLSKK